MAENEKPIDLLEKRLEDLVRTQIDFQKEVTAIRREIALLRGGTAGEESYEQPLPMADTTPPPFQSKPPVQEAPPPQQPVSSEQAYEQARERPPVREVPAPNFGYTT